MLLAGMAGLLAGALSMALGEWISVKSSQELYENQMQLEMDELEHNPEGEERELALIYMSKGIDTTKAKQMANEVMKDKNQAHEVLVREELGINSEELKGSAMEAALASFCYWRFIACDSILLYVWFGCNFNQRRFECIRTFPYWCYYHIVYREVHALFWNASSHIWTCCCCHYL